MKNFSNLKPKIEQLVDPILAKHHLKIYEVNNFKEFGNDTLQILVEDETNPRQALDLDLMIQINEQVSNALDSIEADIDSNYLLEVASAGIERKIKTVTELINSVGQYVFVELNKPTKEKLVQFNATVESYDPTSELFQLVYFVKGQKKKVEISFNDLKTIRYAVKF